MTEVDGWIVEENESWPGQRFSIKSKRKLFHQRSDFQEVEVYESTDYGKVLLLDRIIQCTERDEAAYQEMITHLPLCSLKIPPKRVLIVGGGDGGACRELAKYESIESIEVAEIDKYAFRAIPKRHIMSYRMVIDVSKEYLKEMSIGFSDPRVSVNICDGIEFVKNSRADFYDAIIVDSSDPDGPAEALFQKPFYEAIYRALRPGGIVCSQAESIWLHLDLISRMAEMCSSVFKDGSVSYATISVPSYPSGMIGFMVCMKADSDASVASPLKPVNLHFEKGQKSKLKYYTGAVHSAAFVLPKFALDALSPFLTFQ